MNEKINYNKLRAALVEKKITQSYIAEKAKLSRATINSMLSNKSTITADVLAIIAEETGYSVEYFLCNFSS